MQQRLLLGCRGDWQRAIALDVLNVEAALAEGNRELLAHLFGAEEQHRVVGDVAVQFLRPTIAAVRHNQPVLIQYLLRRAADGKHLEVRRHRLLD